MKKTAVANLLAKRGNYGKYPPETDKQTKYLDLAHEVTDMWGGLPAEIIPVVVSANGLIPVSLSGHLRRLGRRDGPLWAQMQKAVLLDTARIVRRFLSLSS